jgi:hypothetical protein
MNPSNPTNPKTLITSVGLDNLSKFPYHSNKRLLNKKVRRI